METIAFTPTYNEAGKLKSQISSSIRTLECLIENTSDFSKLSEYIDEVLELTTKYESLSKAVSVSKISKKIKKFDNKTLSQICDEVYKQNVKRSYLNDFIKRISEEGAKTAVINQVLDEIDNCNQAITELESQIDYIEANYKIDIS